MTAAGVSGVAQEGSHPAATGEPDAKPEPDGATEDTEVDMDGAGAGLHAAATHRSATLIKALMAHRR